MTTGQLEMFADAKLARDDALDRVTTNAGPWIQACIDALTPEFKRTHPTFTGETLRISLLCKIPEPHHHNAWGALTKTLLHRKIIKPTGRWVSMSTKQSHARATRVYRWS